MLLKSQIILRDVREYEPQTSSIEAVLRADLGDRSRHALHSGKFCPSGA